MNQPSDQSTPPPRPIRVLLLDDEESIRRLLKVAMNKAGFQCEVAANGRQGLQMLLGQTFDVAVVDLRMQEMDGIAFIQEARKIWPWLGFVIYSGFVDDHTMELARHIGIQQVLKKPLDMKLLLEAVRAEARTMEGLARSADRHAPLQLINYQLNMMRHISREMIQSRSLLNGLIQLGQAIQEALPHDVMAILGVEEEERQLLLQTSSPQPRHIVDELKQHLLERYQMLSGQPLDETKLQMEFKGPTPLDGDGATMMSITSVPVMVGEQVQGMLCLGAKREHAFNDMHVALLYHAASHFSAMLSALSEMRQLAIRDPLTGLFNRRHLDEELERAWRMALRYHHHLSVMIIDLDRFKEINDTHGHAAGDNLLQNFAAILRASTRTTDVLARLGGDEFIVILPQAKTADAIVLASRILETIRTSPLTIDGQAVTATPSIGIASMNETNPVDHHDELLKRADRALYKAKNAGKNTFACWEPPTSQTADDQPVSHGRPVRARVLLLDDEEYIVLIFRRILEKENIEVVAARSIAEALDQLKTSEHFDILLCDLSLPDGNGLDFLRVAHEIDAAMLTIVVTGHATTENAIAALRQGAYDFIQKPVHGDALVALINRALQYRALLQENNRYREFLEEMVRTKKSELGRAIDDIKKAYEFTLETMVAMLDAREFETGQHSLRVRDLTLVLARAMGMDGEQLEEIGRGALLHDIGKIGIPDSILLKPGQLNEDEWDIMRKHPEIGYRFVKNSSFLQTAAGIVLSHHERWDGTGYPHQLRGEAINLGARIFAVIDAYDAMRSARVYKQSVSADEALKEIMSESGSQFDPAVVKAFALCVIELEKIGRWSRSFT